MTHTARPSRSLGLVTAALFALVVAACGASASTAVPPTSPSATAPASTGAAGLARTVSTAEADRLRQDGALMLDVREPSEWSAGHIDGATLIPLGELPARLGELPRDRSIVVVCRSGNRSAQGRDILLVAGFAAVTSMDGGMTEWVAAGLPVVTGS
jgi:rhodanese-related sulfurtransferase